MFNFTKFKEKSTEVENWLTREMSSIRTGRASASILDSIKVESYGSQMAINALASITIEDPKTIRIEPWDKSQGKEIEKAIQASNLGISVNSDEKGLRVIFPELTGERREQLIKLAKQKLEDARISLRVHRDEAQKEIDPKTGGGLGEDVKFKLKEELQEMVDKTNKKLEEIFAKKEVEIKS